MRDCGEIEEGNLPRFEPVTPCIPARQTRVFVPGTGVLSIL